MCGGRAVGFEPGCGLVSMLRKPGIWEGEESRILNDTERLEMKNWAAREELVWVDWMGDELRDGRANEGWCFSIEITLGEG